MRIYPPPFEVEDNEGFSPEKDIFGRAELGQGLGHLLEKVTDPIVLTIDGPWGSGKSAFLKMWAGFLRQKGFPVVYFDAFENDYSDDAFTTIASQIIGFVEEQKKAKTPTGKKFIKSATATGRVLLRSGLRLGVKIATLNAFDTKELEDAADSVADELSGLTDRYVGERLTKHRENIKTFDAFRSALSELPELLANSDANLPMVVIIDELDRCRPIYALDLLERIKHFFQVNGVHFVLGANLEQLQNSVSASYGSGIDAKTYLQKFIHLTVPLVDTKEHAHERIANKYITHLRNVLDFKSEDNETVHYACEDLVRIAEKNGLTLRDIERSMSNLALACAFSTPRTLRPPPIIAGLSVMKAIAPNLYKKAKQGTLEYAEVKRLLALGEEENLREASFEEKWWRFCTDRTVSEEFIRSMSNSLHQYSIWGGPEKIVPLIANKVMDRLTPVS